MQPKILHGGPLDFEGAKFGLFPIINQTLSKKLAIMLWPKDHDTSSTKEW